MELVPFAETLKKLSAVCLGCSEEAHFTLKHSHLTGEVEDIGGIDKYKPVCRGCFLSLQSTNLKEQEKTTEIPVQDSKGSSDTKSKSEGSLSDKEPEENDGGSTQHTAVFSCQ